jgi:hypothetical protein
MLGCNKLIGTVSTGRESPAATDTSAQATHIEPHPTDHAIRSLRNLISVLLGNYFLAIQ